MKYYVYFSLLSVKNVKNVPVIADKDVYTIHGGFAFIKILLDSF